MGLAAGVAAFLSPQRKRPAGSLAYPTAAPRAYADHESFAAGLNFPDGDHEPAIFDRLVQVSVGNGRFYGGGLVLARGANAGDAALDVYAVDAGGPVRPARIAWGLRSGEFPERDHVHHWRTRRVRLQTEYRLPLDIDGELAARTPKCFSVAPGALKVLVPPRQTTTEDSVHSSFKLTARA